MKNIKYHIFLLSLLLTPLSIVPQTVHAADINLLTELSNRVDHLDVRVDDLRARMDNFFNVNGGTKIILASNEKKQDHDDRDEDRDRIAPIIENVIITPSVKSAIVSWTTDEETKGTVRYGTRRPLKPEHSVRSSAEASTTHRVELSNLKAETTYYLMIVAQDQNGNKTKTEIRTFTTLKEPVIIPDVTAPNVLFESALLVNADSAHVLWVTNEKSTGYVWLSTNSVVDTQLTPTRVSTNLSLFHDIEFTSLTPNTLYRYVISSTDAAGNVTVLSTNSFRTAAQ